MQVARVVFDKNSALASVARNASCKHGWLRLTIQTIFAIITVSSFIMIISLALRNPGHGSANAPPRPRARCHIQNCRVSCYNAPYFGAHEADILTAISEAEGVCRHLVLELDSPSFTNNTLPRHWLSTIHITIDQLSIINGNLKHIPSGAFMTSFASKIKTLILKDLEIKTWDSTSLVGLSSLRKIFVRESVVDVQFNCLRPVADTLESLVITEGGKWNPVNVTGSTSLKKLSVVDLSYNDFANILTNTSFVGLELTKILYLVFCRITAIGQGAFDHLLNIEVLYLNNNMLMSTPPGLFRSILSIESHRAKINLKDNFWLCNCAADDLRQLTRKKMLLVEASCYYDSGRNSRTFTEMEYLCNGYIKDMPQAQAYIFDLHHGRLNFDVDPIFNNMSICYDRLGSEASMRVISPIRDNKCASNKLKNLKPISLYSSNDENTNNDVKDWLQFSYFMKTANYSIIQLETSAVGKGLLWYQSSCPHILYCVDIMPSFLRVYNIDPEEGYTFCPMSVEHSVVDSDQCVNYKCSRNSDDMFHNRISAFNCFIYISTVIVCLSFGALIVYGVVRRKPTLLKGSKRILFVKHKNVDALVLPPRLPLRQDLKSSNTIDRKDKDIFTLTNSHELFPPRLNRMKSVRSDKSSSPSYISAMQPTEDQLAEWRIRRHFNNDLTINSTRSEMSTFSDIFGDTLYYSLESEKYYDNLTFK